MARVKRMADSVPSGPMILEFLTSKSARNSLVAAVKRGQPPIAGVTADLIKLIGPRPFKSQLASQFCGSVVRAVLEEEGYVPDRTRVHLRNNPLFTTAASYRAVELPHPALDPVLRRFIDQFTDEQARAAFQYLKRRLS